jgi:hypothetical protein
MLKTVIVQTAAAAQTQTATAVPPSTATRTQTAVPTITLTQTQPTPSATVFYSLYTLTPIPTETIFVESAEAPAAEPSGSEGSSATSEVSKSESRFDKATQPTGKPWTCAVVGKYPPMNSVVERRESFYVYWTVLNTGTKTWTNNTIDFVYAGGFDNEGRSRQDLAALAVPPGSTTTVKVLFKAPKRAGVYSAMWSLVVGNHPFCSMKITFEVQ